MSSRFLAFGLSPVVALFAACASPAPRPAADPAPLALTAHRPVQAAAAPDAIAGERRATFGTGFTSGPGSALFAGEIDWPVTDRVTAGPMFQLGTDDNTTLLAPSFQAKYFLPLDRGPVPVVPFLQAGIGLLYLDNPSHHLGGDHDGIGLLVHLGGGVEYRVRDGLTLASAMYVDLLPDEVAGEHALFAWQMLQLGVRF